MSARLAVTCAGAVALSSCGGATAPATSTPRGPWSAMTGAERAQYMQDVVMPRMRAVFAEFDPHRYPKMGCVPCHSTDKARGWKMPNPDLLVAESCISGTSDRLYGSEAAAQAMTRMTDFMRHRVQPEMSALLGGHYDPDHDGFQPCFGCHTMERPAPGPEVPPEAER